MKQFSKYFDHTMLRPDGTTKEIINLCKEAVAEDVYSVCVNPCYISLVSELLEGTKIKITSVIGFPLGTSDTNTKACEADNACFNGANELDMVINIGALKDKRDEEVLEDIIAVCNVAYEYGATVKVILETCLLSQEEIVRGCKLAVEGGADFVKTSTGFSTGGAEVEVVRLMKATVGEEALVKASGEIRDLETAKAMIDAGADRLGTSATVSILKAYRP
ncbi:MAG: deoxyribose-phosphate aldolase [Anaerovoracaceae bacterium]